MHHLRDIRQWIQSGEHEKALLAIDHLLSLAPSNTEAMKLKAFILRAQGFFDQEEKLWSQILVKDQEDSDALEYYYSRYMEEREHFYFTDPVPEGRRYLGSSRSVFLASGSLFLGSLTYLVLAQVLPRFVFFRDFLIQFCLFGLLVLGPFFFLLKSYICSLRHVLIHDKGLIFKTLVFSYRFLWEDFESIDLIYDLRNAQDVKLYLLFSPKKKIQKKIRLELTEDHASVRSRKIFLKELQRCFGLIGHKDAIATMVSGESQVSF